MRSSPAVIGVGATTFGKLPDEDATSLGVWAYREAMADCGAVPDDIDGLIVQRITDYQKFARITGIKPRFLQVVPAPGRLTGGTIQLAASAIRSGAASVVALVYGNDGRSHGARYGGVGDRAGLDAEQLWFPYGMTSPGALNALQFQRHSHAFGTTRDHLGAVSVTFRNHAALNPQAVMRTPITLDDHRAARFICEPLCLLDYCLINDGGIAMIMTSADRAKDFRQKPVYLRGYAAASRLDEGEFPEDFGLACMQSVADAVYPMADVTRADISGLMIYDNFTPAVLFNLEGFGFCRPGESGPWVADGALALEGALPTNSSGGQLSESYMQGWGLNAEIVRQLRGQCGARQIQGAEVMQYVCGAPLTTSIIYGREP